jgi:putative peptidoglycan lipid II flippase
MLPGMIGAGVQQLSLFVSTIIASFEAGAVSILYYADRLNQLPLAVIGVAVGVALLPLLSRQLKAGDGAAAMTSQNRAIEFTLVLALPAAAALIAIPEPIVSVLFQRGQFTADIARATSWALAAFALGLPAYVLVKALLPGFYAREDIGTPVRIACAALGSNIVLSLVLVHPFGAVGIALATAISSWVNAGLLAWVLRRRGHFAPDARLSRRAPRMFAAALLMAAALVGAATLLDHALHGAHMLVKAAALAGLIGGGVAVYGAAAVLLGGAHWDELRAALRRAPRRVDQPPPTRP